MRRVRILDAAASEATEAAAWYELQCPGLGAEFSLAIDAALDLLEEQIVPLSPAAGVARSYMILPAFTFRFTPVM